ncbi:hypothetical protein K503DRAFT_801028 [Rhizopogon vinicolor AM-OR11-026]|uniref:Uncharacterized protein n=1 Tax=Rhizopogon vinicolor AM-OR11-026 TaxID=1314800 RepID=A0A1B7MYP1_9AGAM|nr:hypothetical protein K503DRAFT_801028 [Rhizopogon vinicolor AM-OR11-026]
MKYASRKFIDLIQGATSKWANWDPPAPIVVGDYGMIDKETGEFHAQGNIYNVGSSIDFPRDDPALQPQVQDRGDDEFIAKSWGVTSKTVKATPEANLLGIGNASLNFDLEFDNNKRAAVLIMYKPRYTHLPNDERITKLLSTSPDELKGKYIVTQVISCAAYMMYLSDTKKEKFSVSLSSNASVAPAVDVGGEFSFNLSSEAFSGIFRKGGDPKANYRPLYRLQKPPPKFWERLLGRRGEVHDDDMVEKWHDVDPSWDPLDEQGEEDEIYDAELHGDFGVFNDGYPDDDDDSDY